MRTKEVQSADMVAHIWFSRGADPSVQHTARVAHGNFYFRDSTIYSYGSHFPIARHVTNARGDRAVLFTTRNYSTTTSKHLSVTRQAIAAGTTVFNVPRPDTDYHEDNLEAYRREVAELTEKAKGSRIHGETLMRAAQEMAREANRFIAFFKLTATRLKLPKFSAAELEKKRAATERHAATQTLRDEARRVKYQKEMEIWARRNAEMAAIIDRLKSLSQEEINAEWRAGTLPDVSTWAFGRTLLPDTLLRVAPNDPQTVETSHGASVPTAHAVRALRFINYVWSTGGTWQRNGHTVRVGHFQIDEISAATVRAGCHVFQRAEIERMMQTLNVHDASRAALESTETVSV